MTEQIDINPNFPNAGRVYDYVLGGHHNFEADRQAAGYMISLLPSTPKWVRMLRQFLQEAAFQLAEEGFVNFLDLGSGLPTADHIHSQIPQAKVVYVDSDPVTVAYGMEILQGNPNARYLQADARDIDTILNAPILSEMFGDNRKIAIGFNAMSCFFTDEENKRIVTAVYNWAAPGSKLFGTFEVKNPALTTPQIEQFIGMFNQMGVYYQFTTLPEAIEMMKPWEADARGFKPLSKWLQLQDQFNQADYEGVDLEFYGAILEKR